MSENNFKDLKCAETSSAPFIFWDGYGLSSPESGVFVHAASLARELKSQNISPVVVGDERVESAFSILSTLKFGSALLPDKLSTSKLFWPHRVKSFIEKRVPDSKTVILHGLANINLSTVGRYSERFKTVVTVHDIIPLLSGGKTSLLYYYQFKYALSRVVERADKIVCVSHWTKTTLAERFPSAEEKMIVIPNGYEPRREVTREQSDQISMLCVARYEPYKNHALIFELANLIVGSCTLITDAKGEAYAAKHAKNLINSGKLVIKTNLTHEQVKAHYERANVYVQTSSLEGFCLPAVEAMSSGLSVVYLAGSGIDEVCGKSVCYPMTKAHSAEEWAQKITEAKTAAEQPKFTNRLDEHFNSLTSWKDSAKSLKNLYNSLLNM